MNAGTAYSSGIFGMPRMGFEKRELTKKLWGSELSSWIRNCKKYRLWQALLCM